MERPVSETFGERQANYRACAAIADEKATQSTDETIREAWGRIADSYRILAADMPQKFKL